MKLIDESKAHALIETVPRHMEFLSPYIVIRSAGICDLVIYGHEYNHISEESRSKDRNVRSSQFVKPCDRIPLLYRCS